MTRYQWQYTARLVPLDVPINIPALDGKPSFSYTFDHQTFAGEKGSKRVIDVCEDHNRLKVIGKVDRLIAQLGWWECEFTLDTDQPELERGQPVSIGLQTLGIGSGVPFLTEVSVVPHGAIKGAAVRNKRQVPAAKPEPAKPIAANTPTLVAAGAPAPTTRRRTIPQRHMPNWEIELNRRLDRMEAAGHTDTEAVIVQMQREYANR